MLQTLEHEIAEPDPCRQILFTQLMHGQVDRHAHVQADLRPGVHLPAGLVDDPVAEAVDEAEALGDGDEQARTQQAALGMVPADQGLDAADLPMQAIDLGLVVELQLPLLDGQAQVDQQVELLLRAFVHMRLVQRIGAAAGAFGGVHRGVGVHDQLVPVAVVGVGGDADRSGQDNPPATDLKRDRQRRDQAAGQADAVRQAADVLHQQHELVAANASHGVGVARRDPQTRGDLFEHRVAGSMAERVVDRLEAVKVDEQHGHLAGIALRDLFPGARMTLKRMRQTVLEQHAVGQAGERVLERSSPQLLVGRLQLHVRDLQRAAHAGVERRREQGHRQQGDGRQRHHHSQLGARQRVRAQADRAGREVRRGHARVVHAAYRDAHHERREGLKNHATPLLQLAQPEEDQQRCRRCANGDQRRCRYQQRIPDDAGHHVERGHAGVVHRADAQPHCGGTSAQAGPGELALACDVQRHG
ncbi:hypothetical protein ASC95_18005 [Pelomonas sp. Root1217]|nr:hypothetical protein ASC95_18005 [Pelomonas sp. Root1217]